MIFFVVEVTRWSHPIAGKEVSELENAACESVAMARETRSEPEGDNGLEWTKPTLEDVSGRVMAQPYIRFT
ncbi:MAG: hypothetical protein AB1714_04140 [Acidobacteriota bacterium]